ncbi:MAG TPA: tRNA dihydrouridine synthase DusB, partial [Firmicutes bacterium]|nr:tRNA dihydrouridine synthase DusB [Bacillota bacterium]
VGNGDVFSPEDAQALIEQTNCDHIAIGRGARGNPWIFRQVKAWLRQGQIPTPPSPEEKMATALRHLELKMAYAAGEERAVMEMRPHLAWYLKGLPEAAKIRARINKAQTLSAVREIFESCL